MKRYLFPALLIFFLFLSGEAFAEKARIVGGEGLLTDDLTLVESIWKIGVGDIVPSGEYGYEFAKICGESLPGSFGKSQKFYAKLLEDVNPATLTAEEIISLGDEKEIDAILGGAVNQAKTKKEPWNADFRIVRVECQFYIYDTTTGNRIWERTLKIDRSVEKSDIDSIFRRFSMNMANDCVEYIVEDGIRGRDTGLNLAPTIEGLPDKLVFKTSITKLKCVVKDDLGLQTCSVSIAGSDTALFSQSLKGEPDFTIDTTIERGQMEGSELTIKCIDTQGAESEWKLLPDIQGSVEAVIANVVSSVIFLNKGANAGIETGFLFQVESKTEITDPTTGAVLGTTEIIVGKIEVTSSSGDFAQCKIIEGDIKDLAVGSRVY